MGTRSLTRVIEDGQHYVNLYRQFDGYPSGHGEELAAFLGQRRIVNGYNKQDEIDNAFNGAGCLAASLVAHFKEKIGGFYLKPTEATDCWQDFEYILTVTSPKDGDDGSISIRVVSHGETLFEGAQAAFAEFCNKTEE
jgi:hypothetical protein